MSTFQARPLTDDGPNEPPAAPSSKTSSSSSSSKSRTLPQQIALAQCFPPLYHPPYPSLICRSPSKTPLCSFHHLIGILLLNLVGICAFLPIAAVHLTVYLLPADTQLYSNLIPGFNLTKVQLIGIFVFVCIDLLLYVVVYLVGKYSTAFYGCSTELNYKVFSGSQFIPIILVIKLLQPLTIVSEQSADVDYVFVWSIRLLICIFLLVSIMPLLISEIRLIRGVNGLSANNYHANYYNAPKEGQLVAHKSKMPALLFFSLKVTMLLAFLLEISVINFGIVTPMSIDYPLIFSAANLIFIFYSHRPIIVKYNVIETARTAITSEFGCLDGRRCCNKYRPNKLLGYERTEATFHQAASSEYTYYSQKELPKWLQRKLNKVQRSFNAMVKKF